MPRAMDDEPGCTPSAYCRLAQRKDPRLDNRQRGGVARTMASASLLIIWHSRTGASEAMAREAADGAGPSARLLHCEQAEAPDLLGARGYLFCGPENLAALSGAMKEMFDRLYYPLLGRIEGRAYGTIIAAGSDGSGAQRQIDRIATGWRLRRVVEPLVVNFAAQTAEAILSPKRIPHPVRAQCFQLGAGLAEGLQQGIF